jgi:hypothetical protein
VDAEKTAPALRPRRFALITLVALLIVFGVAVGIIEYGNATTVSMDITGNPHAYFVVAHGSANVTLPEDQNAVVQLPQHTDITVYAFPDASYHVTGWTVSLPTTTTGQNYIELVTGSDGTTIKVSVALSNSSAN